MATAKEYEILFTLKAYMDSAFGTGFNSARTYLSQIQGEVKQYNSILRDISAYQKHTQALETLKGKLDVEKKALADTEEKIKSEGKATKELTAEKQKHEKAINTLNEKIKSQEQTLEQDKQALEQDKVSVNNLAESEAELKAKVEEAKQQMQEFVALQNSITDMANAFSAIKVAADAAANASSALYDAVKECIDCAAELEYTMSAVEAVSGATAEETEQLTALAKEMGATTVYTASECAEALQTEALAGWSVEEMLAGLPAVVNMAAASGESLTEMTSIISDSLSAFGLSGEAAVTKFADVLTTAATSANTTVSLMGESLSYVESTAANLDYSIEDVSVALAVMANNALKGSVSGSALNTMLTRMSGANNNAAGQMDDLNISMYNTDGTAKDLLTFLNELRDAFKQFGDDSQSAQIAAYKLAGQRGMRGLLSIVNTTDEEWQSMVESIYDYEGAAESVSDIRLDNYQGQIYLLESAWDALKTTVGEAFLPVATDAAGVLTDLANVANDFAGENQTLIVSLSAAASAAGIAAVGISGVATALQFAKYALSVFMPGFGGIAVVAGAAAAAIGLTAGAVAAYATALDSASEESAELQSEAESLAETTQSTLDSYEETSNAYEDQRTEANALIDTIEELTSTGDTDELTQRRIESAVEDLNEVLPELNLEYDALSGTLSSTTDEMREFANVISDDEIESKVETLTELETQQAQLEEAITLAEQKAAESQAEYAAQMQEMASSYSDGITIPIGYSIVAGVADASTDAQTLAGLKEQYEAVAEAIKELENELNGYTEDQEDAANATSFTSSMLEEVTEYATAYGEAWSSAYDEAASSLENQLGLMKEVEEIEDPTTMSDIMGNTEDQLAALTEYKDNLQTIFDAAEQYGIDISSIYDDITSGSTDAMELVNAMASDIETNGVTNLSELIDTRTAAETIVEETKSAITDAMPEVQEAYNNMLDGVNLSDETAEQAAKSAAEQVVQGYIDGFTFGTTDVVSAAEDTGGNVAQGLADGMSDDSAVLGAANLIGGNLIDTLKAALGVNSPSTITTSAGQDVDQGLINGMTAKEAAAEAKATEVASATASAFQAELSQSTFYTYGANAIQGAINGINSKRSALVAAAKAAAAAANQAYHDESQIGSPSRLYYYYSEMDVAGGVQGWNANQYKLEQAAADAAAGSADAFSSAVQSGTTVSLTGYASGTDNAEAGLKMVGENGPELVDFSGGETVYTNRETTKIMGATNEGSSISASGGGTIQLTYAPNITINGNADSETLKAALSGHNQELLDLLEGYLNEREASQRRRSY
ncbi:MAG: phage tail tape measure protein [Clostridiales bacterium]|nr:phage tail tape measure protein [Clostridiales bacterium]